MADRGSRQRERAEVTLLATLSPAVHRLALALREQGHAVRLLAADGECPAGMTDSTTTLVVVGEHALAPRRGILRLGAAPRPGETALVIDELACGARAVRALAALRVRSIVASGLRVGVQRGVQVTAAALGLTVAGSADELPRAPAVGLLSDASLVPAPIPRPGQLPVQVECRLPAPAATPGWPRLAVPLEDLVLACGRAIAESRAGQAPALHRLLPAGPQPAVPGVIEDARLQAALDWIAAHAAEHIGVADIATAAGISSRSLQRHFTSELGCSPWSEVLRQRVEAARTLLAGTDATLAEVARQVGFAEADRLSAAFRRFVGCTPGRWRTLRREP